MRSNYHIIDYEEEYHAIHNDLIFFTEYTLEGFSQKRLVTFEKDEAVAVSDDGKVWGIAYYSDGNICFINGLTSKETSDIEVWQHIKKLTDFNK